MGNARGRIPSRARVCLHRRRRCPGLAAAPAVCSAAASDRRWLAGVGGRLYRLCAGTAVPGVAGDLGRVAARRHWRRHPRGRGPGRLGSLAASASTSKRRQGRAAFMSGNTWGRAFTVTSFGESHGPAIGCVVDGCPPGIALDESDLQRELDRRRPGQSRYVTQRREPDAARIVSGVFEGETTGTPIAVIIDNADQRSRDYGDIKNVFRPNHADYAYLHKYGRRDYRGGGRSSARETAVRVAAGAIARKFLAERYGVQIRGYLAQMGPIELAAQDLDAVDDNPFFCAEPARV